MTATTSTAAIRAALIQKREIALFDVREEGVFAEAHPLFAANLPLSRIELEIHDRVPRIDTQIAVYDDGEGFAQQAADRLIALGYLDVTLLEGGLEGWRSAGGEIFIDVNVPSKAFGELVEARRHTPSLSAPEVKELIESKANVVVLDARRFDEYQTMNIPGSISVPGAELVYRAGGLAPDPDTTVIVNCAGRTRSIIGTQSLVNAGLVNKVYALRNGTIGWTLAGQTLEHGQERRFGNISPEVARDAARRARAVADRAGVQRLTREKLAVFTGEKQRTTYLFDVRTPEEFAVSHLPGFRSAPGGQLVQETDMVAPVRGARIVLVDDDGVRANMTGSWLAQMNWDVHVLEGVALEGESGAWQPRLPDVPVVESISVEELRSLLDQNRAEVIDLAPSLAYQRGTIPGAFFATRAVLGEALSVLNPQAILVLASPDDLLARFAAADLAKKDLKAWVLEGGTQAWRKAGLGLETGAARFASPPVDRYRRPYEGTDNPVSAMQAYLDWEFGLVDQLDRDGTHGFVVI